MFCPNCSKLAVVVAKRPCVRCSGVITNNISCICDVCSNEQHICAVCLKKITVNQQGINNFKFGVGCKSCGSH